MSDNGVDLLAVVRLWTRLADEWRERCDEARGPIAAAVIAANLPPDLHKTGMYLAHVAEQRGIDATDLLAFGVRPDLGDRLDAARVVVQRVGLAVPHPESPVPRVSGDGDKLPGGADVSESVLLTVEQAAELLQVDPKTIRRLISKGRLRAASSLGSVKRPNYRIDRADLAAITPDADAEPAGATAPRRRRRQAASSASAAQYLPRVSAS